MGYCGLTVLYGPAIIKRNNQDKKLIPLLGNTIFLIRKMFLSPFHIHSLLNS